MSLLCLEFWFEIFFLLFSWHFFSFPIRILSYFWFLKSSLTLFINFFCHLDYPFIPIFSVLCPQFWRERTVVRTLLMLCASHLEMPTMSGWEGNSLISLALYFLHPLSNTHYNYLAIWLFPLTNFNLQIIERIKLLE